MRPEILDHHRQYGMFTNPGAYEEKMRRDLPDDVRAIGDLVRANVVHRMTLKNGNTFSNADRKYGDMTKMPWWRQCDDDMLQTSSAMLAELYRRDPRGLTKERAAEDKIVVTCRYVAVLAASILKAKGTPARVRSGFDPYTSPMPGKSCDHWLNQYWNEREKRWVTIDVDCAWEDLAFDAYDVPEGQFEWAADAWLKVRSGEADGNRYWNASGRTGLLPVGWELFYDFHCLMGNEVSYLSTVEWTTIGVFETLSEDQLRQMDDLARLMQRPDEHFDELKRLWETKREFRMLRGGLL